MELKGTATFLRDVSEFFTGSAALYHVAPPIQVRDIDPNGAEVVEVIEHVVASTTDVPWQEAMTMVFRADSEGYVLSWAELRGMYGDSHDEVLGLIGYRIERGEGDGG
jgi:hypothetical protein